jgi:hypothetical protein
MGERGEMRISWGLGKDGFVSECFQGVFVVTNM